MEGTHVNFKLTRCGLFINEQYPFLHATPDFLTSCDCCGLGCGEVKCPICIGEDCDFDKYVMENSSCLEKVNDKFQLKRKHHYYCQVQQQLFTVKDRNFCDFVVCGIDKEKKAHIVKERIYPDVKTLGNCFTQVGDFLENLYPARDSWPMVHKEVFIACPFTRCQWNLFLSWSAGRECHLMQQ